eukprot:EW705974.1.p2 GENE.EW705974.1~~EW705974.1.p2  ORF type:complete len:185 (+),score=38.89 EW705974.1:53-607(+)
MKGVVIAFIVLAAMLVAVDARGASVDRLQIAPRAPEVASAAANKMKFAQVKARAKGCPRKEYVSVDVIEPYSAKSSSREYVSVDVVEPYSAKSNSREYVSVDVVEPYSAKSNPREYVQPDVLEPYSAKSSSREYVQPDVLEPYSAKSNPHEYVQPDVLEPYSPRGGKQREYVTVDAVDTLSCPR